MNSNASNEILEKDPEKIRLKKRMDSRGMSDYSPIQTPSIRTNKDLSKMSQEERFAQQSKLGK